MTISSTGRIWFTGYNYGKGFGNYEISRRWQLSIGEKEANNILALISRYFNNEPPTMFATDIGDWKIIITDINKCKNKFKGSLCGGVAVGNTDLSEYIRKHIPIVLQRSLLTLYHYLYVIL